MNNETLPPPPPPAAGARGAGRERVPLQRAGRLFARTADRYGASDLFFSQQTATQQQQQQRQQQQQQQRHQHQQQEKKTDNVPFAKAAASDSAEAAATDVHVANNAINALPLKIELNQPAAHDNTTHMSDTNRAHEENNTHIKMHDRSIPTLAMHRIHREHEYKEPPQSAMVSQEEEKEVITHHSELQQQYQQQEEHEEEHHSVPGKAAVISRRQLSINESASPRPRTPLYDSSNRHFLFLQSHEQEQKLNKQFYNLQDSTPELYETQEVVPSHSAFASTPHVNLNLQEVEAKPITRIPHTTRSDINNNNYINNNDNDNSRNKKMEISSASLSAKSANAITANTTLLRRDVPLFSRSRELAQNGRTPSNNSNNNYNNNDTKVNAHQEHHMNVLHSGISSSRSALRSSLPLHESTPTNAITHRSNDTTIITSGSGGSSGTTIKNDNADRVSSLTRHSLGMSLYSHNRGTPRREGLLEAALRRREENCLNHHNTQTSLFNHLQDHDKVFSVNEKSTLNNNNNSSAFVHKRSTDSPAIRTPISPFVKHIPANSNSSVVMTEKESEPEEEEEGKHLEYKKERKEQEQEGENYVGSTTHKQNDTTRTNSLEGNQRDNEYVEPHNTRTIQDINHNSNMHHSSENNTDNNIINEKLLRYVKEKEGKQLMEQQLLPTNRNDNNNNVLASMHRERAIINPFLSDDDDEDNESRKSNNNNNNNNSVEDDEEEATSNTNKNVIGVHVSEGDREPLFKHKLQTNDNGSQWILNEHQLRNDKDDFSLDSHVHSTHNSKYNNNINGILPMQHDKLQTKEEEEEEEYPLPRVQVGEQVPKITKVASSSSATSSSSPSFASSSTESLFSDKRNHAQREKMYKFAQHSIVPVDAPDDNPFLQPHKIKKDSHNKDDNVRLIAHTSNTLGSEENLATHKEDHALHHVKLLEKEESPRMEPELQNKLEVNHTVTPENVFRLPHSHATKTTLPSPPPPPPQQQQQEQQPFLEDKIKKAFQETNNLEHDLLGRSHNETAPNPFLSSTHNQFTKSSSAATAAAVSSIAQREDDKMDVLNTHIVEDNSAHASTNTLTCEKQEVLFCPCFAVFIPTRGKFVVGYNMSSPTDKAQMNNNNNNDKQSNMSGINTRVQVSNNVNAKPAWQSSSSLNTSEFCDSYLCTCLSLHTALFTPETTKNNIQITTHTRGHNYVKLLRAVATSPFFASVNKPPLNTESLLWAANLLQVDSNHLKIEFGSNKNKNKNNNNNMNVNYVENDSSVEECIPYSLRRVLLCLIEFAQQSESKERRFVWGRGGQKRLIECLVNTENIIFMNDGNNESDDNSSCKDKYEQSINELKLSHSSRTIDLLVSASEQTSSQIASQRDETAKNINYSKGAGKNGTVQSTTSTTTNSVNDPNNALTIVENLISVGKREEAVEVALKHHLYHHAILISMVCAHKDYYLQVVDAIVKEQLSQHSPLAHAYCLFNNRTMPPFCVKHDNDMTSDAQDDEIHNAKESINCNNNIEEEASAIQTSSKVKIQHLLELQRTWRTHASVLISNFSPTSVAALLQLADELQQANLIMAAHTCLLLILLTPVMTSKTATITTTGQSNKSSASREGSSTVNNENNNNSSTTKGAIECHSPMSRNEAAQQLVRRLGVLGGLYHPTQSCRANFLTPLSTILTDILQEVRIHLSLSVSSIPPLHKTLPHDDVHNGNTDIPKTNSNNNSNNSTTANSEKMNNAPGIPERSARFAINFHFMQVLWLYEVGMHQEASHALHTLLTILPASSVASEQHEIIPNTLNAFVYIISEKYLFSKARNAVHLNESNDVINKSINNNYSNNNNRNDNMESKSDVEHDDVKEDEKPYVMENELETQSTNFHNDNNASSPLNISSTLPPEPSFNLPTQPGKAAFHNNNNNHTSNAGPSINTSKPTKTHEQRSLFNILPPPTPPPVSTQKVHEDTTQLPVKDASTESQTDSEIRESTTDSLSNLESKDNIASSNSYSNNSSVDKSNSFSNNSNDNKSKTRNANKRDKEDERGNSKNKALPPPPPPPRRSRSIDAIMRLFGRGKSEKPEDQAKPMILNSDKPPEFDETTGRWMFPETEEEKAERELIKQGPPRRPAPTNEVAPHANNLNRVMHENNTKLDRSEIKNNNNSSRDNDKSKELPSPSTFSHQTPTQAAKEKQQPLPSPPPPQQLPATPPSVAVSSSGQRLFGAAPPVPVGRGHVLPARRGRGGSGALSRPQYIDLFN